MCDKNILVSCKVIIASVFIAVGSTAFANDAYNRCIEQAERIHDQCLDAGHSDCGTTRHDQYEVCRENFYYKD